MSDVFLIRVKQTPQAVFVDAGESEEEVLSALKKYCFSDFEVLGAVSAEDFPLSWWEDAFEQWRYKDHWYRANYPVISLIEDVLSERISPPMVHLPSWEEVDESPEEVIRELIPVKARTGRASERKNSWPRVDPYAQKIPRAQRPKKGLLSTILSRSVAESNGAAE